MPGHLGIEPDRKRTALLQRRVVGRPVPGLVLRRGPTAHALQLPHWIQTVNPSRDLCNKAYRTAALIIRFCAVRIKLLEN